MRRWRLLVPLVGVAALLLTAMPAASTDTPSLPPLEFGLAVLNATPEPVVDPLDPPGFFRVQATEYDPGHTNLVQGTWLNGTGCPTSVDYPVYPATEPNATFADTACPTGDSKDQHVEGLLLAKTGPTPNNASAVAELHSVKGITLTELGWDIRKIDSSVDPRGSHCGGGSPRWNILTNENFYFLACNSPPADEQLASLTGWIRMRWGGDTPLLAFCATCAFPLNQTPQPVTGRVLRLQIVFDEGQDASGGPDQFGAAVLDNIDVNGALVGHGNVDAD